MSAPYCLSLLERTSVHTFPDDTLTGDRCLCGAVRWGTSYTADGAVWWTGGRETPRDLSRLLRPEGAPA